MDARRKSSTKLKVFEKTEYGFHCGDIDCARAMFHFYSTKSGRDKAIEKHKRDTGHKEIYRCVNDDYCEN